MRYLKTFSDCFAWKTHGDAYSRSGIPDIICCIGGKFVAFEVKTEIGKLSKLQKVTIAKIIKAKGIAIKVTSVEDVKTAIQNLLSEEIP